MSQTSAYSTQLAVLKVAVEAAWDAWVAARVGGLRLTRLLLWLLAFNLLGRAKLLDDVEYKRLCHNSIGWYGREYQLCHARLNVGDNLLAVGIVAVGVLQRGDVVGKSRVCILLKGK